MAVTGGGYNPNIDYTKMAAQQRASKGLPQVDYGGGMMPPTTGPTSPQQGVQTPGAQPPQFNIYNQQGQVQNQQQQQQGGQSFYQSPAFAALIAGGAGIASNYMNNQANAAQGQADARGQMYRDLAGTATQQQGDRLARDQAYMQTFNQNPVKQQRDIFQTAALRDMKGPVLLGAHPGDPLQNLPDFSGTAKQYLSDDALAASAANFYTGAGTLSPSAPPPKLSDLGFGDAGASRQAGMESSITGARQERQGLWNQQRQDLLNGIGAADANAAAGDEDDPEERQKLIWKAQMKQQYAQQGGPAFAQAVTAKDDDFLDEHFAAPEGFHWHDGDLSEDGSGFWHKFARYGGIAGAGVATAMTGGAASPLLIAAIGAGSGAAAGWGTGGGTKAALLGAAGGAIPGAAGAIGGTAARTAFTVGANAGVGAAQGGKMGALMGAAGGAMNVPGANAGGGGAKNALLNAVRNPSTYYRNPALVGGAVTDATGNPAIGGLAGMAAGGMDYFNRKGQGR